MPLDAARDGLIALQGQLARVLAARNAALAERVAQLEAANAELADLSVPKTCANWADALRDAVGSVTRTVPGGQVLVRAGVR
jgi:hypothetical protein